MSRSTVCSVLLFLVFGLTTNVSAELIAYWSFDDGFMDSVGDLGGTAQGDAAISTEGKFGAGALQVDGDGDHVDLGAADQAFDFTGDLTVSAWVKPNDVGDDDDIIIGNAWDGSQTPFWLMLLDENTARCGHYEGGHKGVDGDVPDGGGFMDGEWHMITGVVDDQGGTADYIVYVDGTKVGENIGSEDINPGSTTNVWIGGIDENGGSKWFSGLIDDLRIYDHALTEAEIVAAMTGTVGGYPFALSPNPANGALLEATWASLTWRAGDFAVSHDVYVGDSFDDVNEGAEIMFQSNQATTTLIIGFPGFPIPNGLVPGTTYYWRINEVNDADPNSPWKGDVWSFSIPPKTAYAPDPADGAESVETDVTLSWTGGFGSQLHTVYFGDNFADVDNAVGGLPQGTATYTPGPLDLAKTYYWRVDEFDVVETHKGKVWSFLTQGAVGSSEPANGAVDVTQSPLLAWSHGVYADSHQVYFGADREAVKSADTSSPEYKGSGNLGNESYDAGDLEWNTTYYWRIDEANNTNPDSPWTGPLWSFMTANFLVVDDFESYDDIDPLAGEPGVNRIFDKWLDGFGTTTNGALVGNDLPPYAEQTIVNSGAQAMIYRFDNNLKTSEATVTLAYPRDWTEQGVTKLSLWFRGSSANSAERMFVALGNAVVYHDDPAATQISGWNEWVIDLQAFAGVDLANVNTITIGIGTKGSPAAAGGTGTMYFDDIRLVR